MQAIIWKNSEHLFMSRAIILTISWLAEAIGAAARPSMIIMATVLQNMTLSHVFQIPRVYGIELIYLYCMHTFYLTQRACLSAQL